MAKATKNARTIVSEQTNDAAGSTSGSLDLSTALGLTLAIRIENGDPAPSTPCDAEIYISTDGSDYYHLATYTQEADASETVEFTRRIDPPVMDVKVKFEGNDDEDVTVTALGHELTEIG